jgi:hypothetical protein
VNKGTQLNKKDERVHSKIEFVSPPLILVVVFKITSSDVLWFASIPVFLDNLDQKKPQIKKQTVMQTTAYKK